MSTLTTEQIWERITTSRMRRELTVLSDAMEFIHRAKNVMVGVRSVRAEITACKLSAHRLKAVYYKWLKGGIASLINHNHCGGCGLERCHPMKKLKLNTETLDHWRNNAASNDKRGMRDAWRKLMAALGKGDVIPGAGTWVQLYTKLHPHRAIPAGCPWSIHTPPPGWTLGNFTGQKQPEAEFRLQQKGYFDAAQELPMVRMKLEDVKPLMKVVFDDHPLDFRTMEKDRQGKYQAVRMLGLFAMDLCSRQIVAFGLRPQLMREDGTKEGLTLRDMQHLIAQILARHGYPKNYQLEFIVENGTAAITQELEGQLFRASHGQIVVRRTGMITGDLGLEGYSESSGNPRGKPWLESFFNLLDIVLGQIKGQTGSNYVVKPGDHEGRISAAHKMARVLESLPESKRQGLLLPFEHATDAFWIVSQAIDFLNHRTDHELLGFDEVRLWRFSPSDHLWKPMVPALADSDVRGDVEWFYNQSSEVQDRLLTGNSLVRMESPTERWMKLYKPSDFHRITPAVFIDLMMDTKLEQYRGGDVIDLKIKRGPNREKIIRYRGAEHQLALGDEVICRFDSDNPGTGVWFQDKQGRYRGMMHACEETTDVGRLQADLGARAKALGEMQRNVRARKFTPARLEAEIARYDHTLEIVSTLTTPKLEAAPDNASSTALAREVMRPRKRKELGYIATI